MGKANQLPTLILTLWGDSHAGTLDVATVKNRFGPQVAMGKKFFRMSAEPGMCWIDWDEAKDLEHEILFRDGVSVDDEDKVDVWAALETT